MTELRVSKNTQAQKLGGAIAKYLEEEGSVTVSAMGNDSVATAVKGLIVAQSFLASSAKGMRIRPGFIVRDDEMLQKEVTVIIFQLTLEDL